MLIIKNTFATWKGRKGCESRFSCHHGFIALTAVPAKQGAKSDQANFGVSPGKNLAILLPTWLPT
jgi:hypothetical protein